MMMKKITSTHLLRSGFMFTLLMGIVTSWSACLGTKTVIQATKPVAASAITLPLGGNSWKNGTGDGRLTKNGIQDWKDGKVSFTAYIRLGQTGHLDLWVDGHTLSGKSKLTLAVKGKEHKIKMDEHTDNKPVYAGEWKIKDTGYVAIHIQGISKEGATFASIKNLILSGSATEGKTAYTENNKGNFFYWGRRGASVHLKYNLPKDKKIEWFYNELTVPEGADILGSYFMADGFSGGYFGMQVNSSKTRHILFSVWSPYKTDNPRDIPDSLRIQLLKKGKSVHAGQFGNEGSGGQSYLNYRWKAGHTYKFLLHGVPDGTNYTIYTAYFYAPEKGKWQLIASFRRPKTHAYLKGLHSFLENFSPRQGNKERMAFYGNQWICTADGQWIELNKARFTTDNTGNKGYRMDFGGGVKNKQFYMKNGGFFNDYTPANTTLERKRTGGRPEINLREINSLGRACCTERP